MVKSKQKLQSSPVAVADRLHSAAIHLLRRVRSQDTAAEVGPAQLSALSVLVFAGPATLGQLAAAEQVKPPTMSLIVAALKRRALVITKTDAHDARRMLIRATPKGIRLLQAARRRRIAHLARQVSRLTPAQLRRVQEAVEMLEKLLQNWPRER